MNMGKINKFQFIYLALILLFVLLAVWIINFSQLAIDLPVSSLVQQQESQLINNLMTTISKPGDTLMLPILTLVTAIVMARFGHVRDSLITVMLPLAGWGLGALTKLIINRPRPNPDLVVTYQELLDKSFPSLHVLVYTAFFGYVAYFSYTKIQNIFLKYLIMGVCLFFVGTIGLSRVYLGVHWASDVIGGYILGLLLIIMAINYGKR